VEIPRSLENNRTVGYDVRMKRESEAAKLLGKASAQARRRKLGEAAFRKKMKALGKLGGRPRKSKAARRREAKP
jgi:hypothetical protein